MAKGSVVLKISGILGIIFGILGILYVMLHGFIGAMELSSEGRTVVVGLLIFFGLFGVLFEFFEIATAAMCIRSSKTPARWKRILIWGIIVLALGVFLTVTFYVTADMIKEGGMYPKWYGFVIVIGSGIILPLIMILGGLLNRMSFRNALPEAKTPEKAPEKPAPAAAADNKAQPVGKEEKAKPAAATAAFTGKTPEKKAAVPPVKRPAVPVQPAQIPENPSGRLAYLKNRRLTRCVDPRAERRFKRGTVK